MISVKIIRRLLTDYWILGSGNPRGLRVAVSIPRPCAAAVVGAGLLKDFDKNGIIIMFKEHDTGTHDNDLYIYYRFFRTISLSGWRK